MAQRLTAARATIGQIQLGRSDTIIFRLAGVPVGGTSGTLAGFAGKGSLCIDDTDGAVYMNTNTKASPTWSSIGTVAGLLATGAELNTLHSVVAGAAQASKAVVLDAGISVAGENRQVLTKTANYPIVAGDSTKLIIANPTATDITLTLPAVVAGFNCKIKSIGTGSAVGLTIAVPGGAKLHAHGITASAGKGIINTFATEADGDSADIECDGTDYYASVTGTWARVA